jgi:hypothetical protein
MLPNPPLQTAGRVGRPAGPLSRPPLNAISLDRERYGRRFCEGRLGRDRIGCWGGRRFTFEVAEARRAASGRA